MIQDFLQPLMPNTCTLNALSEQPGKCIPVLYAVLQEYELEHEQNNRNETKILPRLFSLAPQPSLHWRFVTINAKALKVLVGIKNDAADYEGNLELFNTVFDMDKYNFRRSVTYPALAYKGGC